MGDEKVDLEQLLLRFRNPKGKLTRVVRRSLREVPLVLKDDVDELQILWVKIRPM